MSIEKSIKELMESRTKKINKGIISRFSVMSACDSIVDVADVLDKWRDFDDELGQLADQLRQSVDIIHKQLDIPSPSSTVDIDSISMYGHKERE